MNSKSESVLWRLLAGSLFMLGVLWAGCAKGSDPNPDNRRTFVPVGWSVEEEIQGDLNDDGIPDAVMILKEEGKEDPLDQGRSLVVLLGRNNGSFELIGVGKKVLLCVGCFGIMAGRPVVSIQRRVLVVDQLRGSRETSGGLWRFRFDPSTKRMRLIGLDVTKADRGNGESTFVSTNYLNGKQVAESRRYDRAKNKVVVVGRKLNSIVAAPIFLEDADTSPLDWGPEDPAPE